jgi:hypothetical protein
MGAYSISLQAAIRLGREEIAREGRRSLGTTPLIVTAFGGADVTRSRIPLLPDAYSPVSARKVITFGYEDSGYTPVMNGICHKATGGMYITSL